MGAGAAAAGARGRRQHLHSRRRRPATHAAGSPRKWSRPLREAVAAERAAQGVATAAVRSAHRAVAAAATASTTTRSRRRWRNRAVEPGDHGYPTGPLDLHARRLAGARAAAERDGGRWWRRWRSPVAAGAARRSAAAATASAAGRRTTAASSSTSAELTAIEVLDEASRRVRIEPGARWVEVAAALAPHGWALSSGDYGGVGVGGLATAGGIGWLVREHGLTIDHLRAVEIVLADGSRGARRRATQHPDLFWARARRRRELRHRHVLRVRGRRGRRRRFRPARLRRRRTPPAS